jgi:hypothetical protein
VENIGDCALYRLRKLLLDLLGNNRCVAAVLGVGLVCRLVIGVGACGVDLQSELASIHILKSIKLTPSGRFSSRPLGATFWTLSGTADSPVAWDLPWPYSLEEDILIEVCLKMVVCWVRGREMLRSLRAKGMMDGI